MHRNTPLVTLELPLRNNPLSPVSDGEDDRPAKRFYHYIPLYLAVFFILSPHPSVLVVLVNYHLKTLNSPLRFTVHLLCIYLLTFLAFSSLIVCIARDPGSVNTEEQATGSENEDGEMSLTEALIGGHDDSFSPERWCRRCQSPKPERAHHCSQCGRCVLKMDHHCAWVANKCIGHRTYPAFVHFLTSVTLLAAYITLMSGSALWFAFTHPLDVDEKTPIHELFIFAEGFVFSLVIGSFLIYHIYLVSTNQTTLEHLSPFLLLRYLPPFPPSEDSHKLSNPPEEHELSFRQRSLIRAAHGHIRLYDVGWRKNWAQVFGWNKRWGWVYRLVFGGGCRGDGRHFPRNPRTDEMLARLASELVKVDKDN
ncbi:zf-DHHC-domain-containing protein [Gloeophyllum trabeum ATCC 11539]|uniref:Palmitoyltransferase n=1 Tax=Gloeophyllum trabeum (strain ATCC 11539 / FP-39264 / Madison 617) TaxID=670483 RepID=S7PT18_GLOTA|nr:zf-DHHC-domain-containing protein [Gloeophyllum trabeum ATCC 11539]EPQ50961.1 zf-DHHC-domain-containing protein [Gloeophyllum trabeum ATCC 11539]